MGLGGDLLWTPVLNNLYKALGKPVAVCSRPRLTDIIAGRAWAVSCDRMRSPVFELNPYCVGYKHRSKTVLAQKLDALFELCIQMSGIVSNYDNYWYSKSKAMGYQRLYLDLPQHSYTLMDTGDRYIWKTSGHIIDIISRSVGLEDVSHSCELYFSENDYHEASNFVKNNFLNRFVVIEPWTNTDYFGDLRAWPFDRWQQVVYSLNALYPDIVIVQVGVNDKPILDGVVNACGRLSFRGTALLIEKSIIFLGTEGGLMHVANAVNCPSVIVWSGVTLPSFAGYPSRHRIVHHSIACAPCGFKGGCSKGRSCILDIPVSTVVSAIQAELIINGKSG